MLKSELCLWNFPSLPPPRVAQPRARVGVRAACEAWPGRSLSRVLALPLRCPRSMLPSVRKVPFTACIVFSIRTQVLLMLPIDLLSLYPLLHSHILASIFLTKAFWKDALVACDAELGLAMRRLSFWLFSEILCLIVDKSIFLV